MKRILREPLLHFFILGVFIFALFSWVNDDDMRAPDEIVIDTARIDALDSQFRRVWQRPPTPDELSGLVDNWIREEVLYREGMALGLDRGDPVLRRRIAQKVEFISEEMDVLPPAEQELKAWFEDHADDYVVDPRFSFRQLYFNPTVRGQSLDSVIENARQALAAGNVPDSDATMLPATVNDASLAEIRRAFGDDFAESLAGLSVGEWLGPVVSGYGLHLVRVDQMQPARTPPFDEVRATVERDFRAIRASEFRDTFYETLLQRYKVTYEDGVRLADKRGATGRMK